jgi:site-specific DNA-methyltransferase (adenine-specific)
MLICKTPKIRLFNMNNLEYMKTIPDKHYDLALLDPPYEMGKKTNTSGDIIKTRTLKPSSKRRNTLGKPVRVVKYTQKDWDYAPPPEYWEQLFRISKNQVIWGGNHFPLPISKGWIFWDKMQPKEVAFSAGELAWTSYDSKIRKFEFRWAGFAKQVKVNRIHSTQKPVELYEFCLNTFAKKGFKVIDTHSGSGSALIACYKLGIDCDGIEKDEEHFKNSKKRIKEFIENYHTPLNFKS